ncbi:MAG TPA: VWA domain-containing protein, partial [Pirellulales bacterium]|nr:VWA domain-containing protein [Pirellulales bacterium]
GTATLGTSRARAAGPAHLGDESESKATLLGIDAKGSKIVYVFDHSGSMGVPENKPLDRAKAELLASIDALSDVQQFYIIFYNQEQRVFRIDPTGGRLIFGTDHNKKLARQFVDSIHAEGATKHADALAMALGLRPDVIFLLTDGDPPDDITKDELARLDRLNGSGTVINVIQISPPLGEGQSNLLETLAKRTGGQHVYVDFTKPAEK